MPQTGSRSITFCSAIFSAAPTYLPLAEHDYIANAHGYIDDAMIRDASYL